MTKTWMAVAWSLGAGFLLAWGCASGDTVDEGFEQVSTSASGAGGSTSSTAAMSSGHTTGSTGVSSSQASSAASSSSSASSSSAQSSSASSSSTGPGCPDTGPGEPNDTESTALDLGLIDDCDGSGSQLAGRIAEAGDVDWYKYQGDDTFGCVVDPTREFVAESTLRICKFVQCLNGNPDIGCPGGTTPSTSPDGRTGCCSTTGFDLSPDCDGADDDAHIYIRIDAPDDASCVGYSLAYHY